MAYVASVPTWNYCSCMIFLPNFITVATGTVTSARRFWNGSFVLCHIKLVFVVVTVLVVNEKKLIFRLTQRCT